MPQTGAPSEEQFGKRASEGLEPIKKPKVDLGVTTPSEVQQYNNPKTPHSFVAPPALPDRTLITAERMKETYRQISERTLSHTPDTMFWAAGVKNDPITARVTDEVLTHFTTYYGNEDLAAFLSAELLGDEQATRTIATLKYLRGYETPTQTQPVLRGTVPPQAQTGALPEDVLKQVLADPSAIQNLSTLQQQQVSSMADELLSTIETLPDQGIAGDIKRAVYIGRTGDTSVALTEADVAAIKTIPSILEGVNIGGTTQEAPDKLKDIGIDQVRQLENGVIVLDMDTAKADPAKAYAIEIMLQQDYPDLKVQYGREGALGWLMDKLGQPLDYVAAPIGAGLKQISEIADRVRSPEDRQKFLDIADQMEGFIKNNDAKGYGALRNAGLIPLYNLPGGVDPTREDQNWVEEAQRAIAMFRDWGTEEVGFEDFANQTVRNTRPAVLGLGVSEDLARAADVLPGDREYGPLMVGGMLVTIAFDPFNWAPGLIGGLKAAKYIPKLHAGALDDYFRAVAGDIRELRPELNYEQSLDAARAGFRGAIGEDAIYPLVGRGVWKDSVYRRFARFADDPRMQQTVLKSGERLYQIKKAAGEDRTFAAIAKLAGDGVLPGGDTLLARDLARANSVEDMQAIQMKAVLGLDEAPLNVDQYIQERSAVTAELNRRAIRPTVTTQKVADIAPISRVTPYDEREIASLMEDIQQNGITQPLVLNTNAEGGTYLFDGGHRLEAARRLGIEEIPTVTARSTEEAQRLADMGTRSLLPSGPIDGLVARREWLNDVIDGRDYVRPLEQLMTAKQIRQIARAANAPLNPIQNGIMHVIDMTERFPGNILSIPRREGREYMIAIENMHKETGAGEVIIMPWQAKRAPGLRVPTRGIIENAAEDSFSHLYNQARIFGLRKDRINELMAGWKDLHNAGPSASYDWLKNFWETMIDESPRLNSLGRRELKRMHKTFSSDWAPGYITKVVDGETIHSPTIYRTATDISGNPIKLGKPVFSSDMLSAWRTPDIALERSYLTALQGEMRKWEQAGKVRKTIATAHSGLSQFWSEFNNIWRSVVLGARPVAVPARIFNEQMLRIAGFGYDSAVWHPLEWFLSTKAGLRWNADDFIRNVDVPTFSLGSAVKELESHPGFAMMKAGRESVSQADGAMFYRATAADLNRMYAAPELHTAYLPHLDDVEEVFPEGTVFHGSKTLGGIEQADVLQYGNREALMGPGLYLTDDASVAASKGYGAGKILPAQLDPNLNLLDADAVLPDEIADIIDQHLLAQGDLIDVEVESVRGKTGAQAIKDYKRVLADSGLPRSEGGEIMDDLAARLEQAGYSGWKYRGGVRTGSKEHNVTVLFDTGDVPLTSRVTGVAGTVEDAGPRNILANMERTDAGREMITYYRSIGMDPLEAVENTAKEIKQAIGTGPASTKVRELLRGGKVEIDGEIFRVGTSDLAKKLQKLADRGDWVPGKSFLNRSAGDYLPIERSKFAPIKDTWFKWIYSNPDLAASRSPLFRQMAARKYKNLVAHGYDKTRAENLAIAYGARGTSDYMFTIGAKTSGEYFLKNLNPFFPAYRELATTWLKRLPMAVGEGHWALGAAAIARRADIWMHVFQGLGIVQKDEQGNLVIPLPGFGKLVSALTGANAEFSVTTPLDSLAGILPLPSHLFDTDEQGNPLPWEKRLQGILPTLGGPATFVLGELKEVPGLKDALSEVEDWVTLYGTDSSLGPLAADRFWEAFGGQAPWMTNTTKDFHEVLRTFAVVDGMRLAQEEMGPAPDQTKDPKGYKKYVEELMAKGEHYATVTYIIKGAASMLLPFSVGIEDEGKKKMAAMWGLINALPQDESGFNSAVIDSVLTEYPSLQAYMTGKTLDLRPVDHPGEGIDAYFQAIKDGDVVVPNPLQHIIFSLGMQSYSLYQSKVAATFDSDATVAEQLLDFDARETRKQLRDDWDFFLDQSEVNLLPGQTQSFADMYKTYNHYKDMRDGIKTPRLSQEQQKILDIADLEDAIAEYQVAPSRFSEKYYDAKKAVYDLLDYEPTSDFGKAQKWYFEDYTGSYHDRVDKLYDEAHRLENVDQDAGPVYDEIRAISDKYNHPIVNPDHPEWGKFPSPEEYSFINLDEKNQDLQVTQWADRPTEWLTAFQRSQVFPDLPENKQDEAGRLSDLVTRGTRKLDAAAKKAGLDDQSTEVQNAEAALAGLYKARAKEMGIQDYWAAANAPLYQRLDSALGLSDRTQSWVQAERWAKQITDAIEATPYADDNPPYTQFYSARGSSEPAVAGRQLLIDRVAQWRKNDEEFDKVMGGLQVSLGEEGKPLSEGEVVEKVFFNVVQISFG